MVLAGGGFFCASAPAARADEVTRLAKDLRAKYAAQLEELAAWCDEQGLAHQARKTRSWLGTRDPNKLYVTELPQSIGPAELPADTPAEVVEWNSRFWRLRRQVAGALEKLARRAVVSDRASLAFELAAGAARENPDQEAIRRLFGFQRFQGGWHTLYEIDRLRANQAWTDQFGWLPKSYVRRYEQGERRYQGRWIAAEEDARLHADIRHGWEIETEHYKIRTNHSLEAGVALGIKLERLHRVWRQLFIRYYASEAQVRDLFDGRPRRRAPLPQHEVVYFRTKEDYVKALKPVFPNVGISTGIYVDNPSRAYFFAGDEYDERNMYHEATHQLFHESRRVAPDVGARGNFWLVEGIALYMESLRAEDGFHVLGGFDDVRMKAARYRLLHDDFYVPLAEFGGMGMHAIQSDKRIATLYSQAAGLTHFLIHYDGGRYRDALVACLSAVYDGRDNPLLLPQLTGTSSGDLDSQYREFITSGGEPPAARAPADKKPAPAAAKED